MSTIMIVDGKERPEVSNPDLGKFFFKDVFKVEEYVKKGITKTRKVKVDNLMQCKFHNCNQKVKRMEGSGPRNLISHLQSNHKNYLSVYWDEKEKEQFSERNNLNNFVVSVPDKVRLYHAHLSFIIDNNMSPEIVDKASYREFSKHQSVGVKTLKVFLTKANDCVVDALTAILPDKFGIIFDGWSADGTSTHYVSIFAIWQENTRNNEGNIVKSETKKHLLAVAPLMDESNQSAQNHKDFIKSTLVWYGKNLHCLLFLVGDNCNTNKNLATLIGVPLIGCVSHRWNLAVQHYLEPYEPIISKIESLMKILRTNNNSGILRSETLLKPQLRNETRWSGIFFMVQKYIKIRNKANLANLFRAIPSVVEKLLAPADETAVDELFKKLEKFQSATLYFQKEDITLSDARYLLDTLLNQFPDPARVHLRKFLSTTASIIHDKDFESAIIKILRNRSRELTDDELSKVECFLLKPREDNLNESIESSDDPVEVAMKRRKIDEEENNPLEPQYQDLSWIPCTSNDCERLNSLAGILMSPLRRSMRPITLERLLILKYNIDLWSLPRIAEYLSQKAEEEDDEEEEYDDDF